MTWTVYKQSKKEFAGWGSSLEHRYDVILVYSIYSFSTCHQPRTALNSFTRQLLSSKADSCQPKDGSLQLFYTGCLGVCIPFYYSRCQRQHSIPSATLARRIVYRKFQTYNNVLLSYSMYSYMTCCWPSNLLSFTRHLLSSSADSSTTFLLQPFWLFVPFYHSCCQHKHSIP